MRKSPTRDRLLILGIAGVATPILTLVGLFFFALQIDTRAHRRSEALVMHGINMSVKDVADSVVPQAIWSDAVRNTVNNDIDWLRKNVGEFFTQSNDFEYVSVFDGANRTQYALDEGREIQGDGDRFAGVAAPLISAIRSEEAKLAPISERLEKGLTLSEPVQRTTIVNLAGEPYLLAATLMQPDFAPVDTHGPAPIMIVGEEIDAAFLAAFSNHYMLDELFVAKQGTPDEGKFAQAAFGGSPEAPALTVRWQARTPGTDLFRDSLPLVLVGTFALAGLALSFHQRARRAIEQLVDSERRSAHLAHHDSLTGLPNRALFAERLQMALETARRSGRSFAVHCIDLDRFKDINDTFGHLAGDELIRRVSRKLQEACRQTDTIARLGGDEFAVIQVDTTPENAALLAERIVASLAEPEELSIGVVYFGASIGITYVTSENSGDPTECLRQADLAMYRAKERGRGGYCFFEPDMDTAIQTRRLLQDDLRKALAAEELYMVYQPQVDVRDRVTGVEALIRWNHATRGAISPAVFVPLAEECGLIEQLGWFAMRRAFVDSAQWPDIKIGVNVSAAQLRHKQFLDGVKALALETKIDPHRFELEITEGLLLADAPEVHATLAGLREMGFQIALDDFGTGYSSLSYLKRYPITRIKIDRSFITNLGVDAEAEDVVAAIVRLARALNMAVVAEGVETVQQRERLTAAGCRDIQGYLASRPLAMTDISGFIDSHLSAKAA